MFTRLSNIFPNLLSITINCNNLHTTTLFNKEKNGFNEFPPEIQEHFNKLDRTLDILYGTGSYDWEDDELDNSIKTRYSGEELEEMGFSEYIVHDAYLQDYYDGKYDDYLYKSKKGQSIKYKKKKR
ncbi:hypothetical protein AYI68_g8403 [Smittium mucronatum]|uniref:Uncharacterized protein n=1 Tax=Smittium mucronatum TaxID=133383 RepID=A0A1R0GKX1_9FUNG|nr:hypothetical protein AYI68_g8403 [Smittium mucronatum]